MPIYEILRDLVTSKWIRKDAKTYYTATIAYSLVGRSVIYFIPHKYGYHGSIT